MRGEFDCLVVITKSEEIGRPEGFRLLPVKTVHWVNLVKSFRDDRLLLLGLFLETRENLRGQNFDVLLKSLPRGLSAFPLAVLAPETGVE